MPNLIDTLDAAYNIVRPARSYPYPIVQDGHVYLDPLSRFVANSSVLTSDKLLFISSLSFVGNYNLQPRNSKDLLIDASSIMDLNTPSCGYSEISESIDRLNSSRSGSTIALRNIVSVLSDIPSVSWIQLDADTLRFAKALVEFAAIVLQDTEQ